MAIYKSFNDIPVLFLELIRNSGTDSLFFSQEWFENYVRTVVPEKGRISIFAESSDGTVDTAVMLPMYDEGSRTVGAPRRLCGLANFYSSRFEPLWASGEFFPSISLQSLVGEIISTKPGWDIVNILPCRSDSIALRRLGDAFTEQKWAVQKYHCFKNPYLENAYRDFGSYLASRSSRIRKTTANRARKFDRDPSNSFEIITSPEKLEDGMDLFSTLYEKRWKKSEPFPTFLPNLAKICAENGWLRLGIASINGRPGAVQFWIVKDSVAYIYKVAYDEEFTKMSVGTVALFKMFQHVLDNESVHEIDFLTGDDAYKNDWMNNVREMTGLVAFNKRTVRGLAAAWWHLGRRAFKLRLASMRQTSARNNNEG